MSEQTADVTMKSNPGKTFDRGKDRARLKGIAGKHFAAAMAAITLFAAGDLWAGSSQTMIAQFTGVANGVVGGYVLAFLAHEWGHFSGARMSGAMSPVLREPRGFFMFNFKFEHNTTRQFLWMSLGGPVANWLLVIAVWLCLPMDSPGSLMLLATTAGIAVNVCVFELPIIQQTMAGGAPQKVLQARVEAQPFSSGRTAGIVTAAAIWLIFV